jgi:hypothetical protein
MASCRATLDPPRSQGVVRERQSESQWLGCDERGWSWNVAERVAAMVAGGAESLFGEDPGVMVSGSSGIVGLCRRWWIGRWLAIAVGGDGAVGWLVGRERWEFRIVALIGWIMFLLVMS